MGSHFESGFATTLLDHKQFCARKDLPNYRPETQKYVEYSQIIGPAGHTLHDYQRN